MKFRHIQAQEGQANNIEAINHGIRKQTRYKNYKDMLGSNNILWKANKAYIEQDKARKSNREKKVWIVAKKLHPHS